MSNDIFFSSLTIMVYVQIRFYDEYLTSQRPKSRILLDPLNDRFYATPIHLRHGSSFLYLMHYHMNDSMHQ